MKKAILGILLAGTILFQPIQIEAHERQCPKSIELSYEDAQLLMKIASAEALNQGELGMQLIMSVVLNRVEDPSFPDTVRGVIYEKNQFYTKGMESAELTPEVHMALAQIEMGNKYPGIIGFEKRGSTSLDKYFTAVFTSKDHTFYVMNQ